ncbi:HAMP domain-containing protein [Rhodococcoides fascians]|uniref:HAMP domain-containing protein n=1 Tax=Rhodococcoides fascians TaxID=1828 RepID=UPI00068CDE1A|nr:HAMP domain-containing protein [Rhodococcus fascians]
MTKPGTGLRTASLRRRLVISTIVAVILVLGAAVAATEILVGAQLKATATAQLDDRVQRARSIHDTGADPAAVVTAAQGGGTTARLVTTDGRTYGNPDLDAEAPTPAPPQPGDPAAPPAAPLQPPGPPPSGTDSESVTTQLSDGSLLTVAVDTAAISDVRDQLRSVLVAVFLVALVLVGLAVVVIVRTSLRPLHQMTVLARRIASGARGDRLDPDRTNTEIGSAAAAFDEMLDSVEAAEQRERATSARTR